MGFAVFHPGKGTGSGGGIGHHIDRTPGHEHSFLQVDPARQAENINFSLKNGMNKLSLPDGIAKRIEEGYTGKKAIRKDAVKFLTLVLTGTHEDMKQLASNPAEFKAWQKANYDFVAKEFGEKNILRFTLHMDEKTPHIHAIVVPLTSDGRLSAKEIMGNKKNLSERQDRYAVQMEPFGLSRGVVGSKARHTSEGWYLAQQKEARERPQISSLPEFGFKDRLDPSNYEKAVKTVVNTLKSEVFEVNLDNRRRVDQVTTAEEGRNKAEKGAELQKQAVDNLAKRLLDSGKEGIKLNAAYALIDAPQALREAANKMFSREVKVLSQQPLKDLAIQCYKQVHAITATTTVTKGHLDELIKRDTTEYRDIIAKEALNRLSKEIKSRWGITLNPDSKLYKGLREKSTNWVQEITKSIIREVKKALGLKAPTQQKSKGIRR